MKPTHNQQETKHFAICICNKSYEVSLEKRKLYKVLDNSDAARHHQIRVIDESGEDYLYPQDYFIKIALPQAIERALAEVA